MLLSARSPSLLSRSVFGIRPRDRFELAPALAGRLYRLPRFAPPCLDLQIRGGDCWVQFGNSSLELSGFDDTIAVYYPAASAWDTEPIGIPLGATRVIIMPTAGPVQVALRIKETLPSYGGTQQMESRASRTNVCVQHRPLGTTIPANTHISFLCLCKRGSGLTGNAGIAFNISPAAAAGTDVHPRVSVGSTAGNLGTVSITNDAGTGAGTPATAAWNDQEWTLLGGVYHDDATTPTITIMHYNDGGGLTVSTVNMTGPVVRIDAPLTHIHIGGNNAGATTWEGDIGPVRVMLGEMTEHQFMAHWGPNAQFWPYLDTLTTVAFIPWLSAYQEREWCSGGDLALTSGDLANRTFAAMTGPSMAPLNRFQAQSASTVKNTAYNEADLGADVSLGTDRAAIYRSQKHHALKYDAGSTADPDNSDATVLPAGVSLTGQSAVNVTDFKNQSGSASDTGVHNTISLTNGRAYGEKKWVFLGREDISWQDQEIVRNTINGKLMVIQMSGQRAIFGYLDGLTGRWEDETLGADVYLVVSDAEGYPGVGKGVHWGRNSSGIQCYGIKKVAGVDRLHKWALTFDGVTGHLTGVVESTLSTNNAHNTPLAAWAPSETNTAIMFGGGSGPGGVQYVLENASTNYSLAASAAGLTGFRMIGVEQMIGIDPLQATTYAIATVLTGGATYGQIIRADWKTQTHTVITDVAGLSGNNVLFDPNGMYFHEFGELSYMAFTSTRAAITFFRPDGDGTYSPWTVYNLSDIWQGSVVGVLYGQSSEPVLLPLPDGTKVSGMVYSIVDGAAVGDPIQDANSIQIWASFTNGSHIRIDRGVKDGSTNIRHEAEVLYSSADPTTGLKEIWFMYGEFHPTAAKVNPVLCNTGLFFTP